MPTIHGTPKRSVHMPKPLDQNVSPYGSVTSPPSARASKTRLPVASSAAE